MDKLPKISVIIPIYNASKYLSECLDSILNQTYKNLEIICVNDGSKDNSLEILKDYEKKYSNIKVISKENGGVIDTRIVGLQNATGEYIGWVDSDDFIEPNMYEEMYKQISEKNADYVICNYRFYPKNITKKTKWFKEIKGEVTGPLIMDNIVLWNELVKKSLIDKMDTANLMRGMGEGAYSLVVVNANKVVTVNKELYNYRVGHTSLSTNYKNIEWFKKVVSFNEKKYEHVKNNGSYSQYWINYFKFEYLYYVLVLMVISAFNNSKSNYEKCIKILKDNNLFDNSLEEFVNAKFSLTKRLFFKYVGTKSFYIMKLASKFYLK